MIREADAGHLIPGVMATFYVHKPEAVKRES